VTVLPIAISDQSCIGNDACHDAVNSTIAQYSCIAVLAMMHAKILQGAVSVKEVVLDIKHVKMLKTLMLKNTAAEALILVQTP